VRKEVLSQKIPLNRRHLYPPFAHDAELIGVDDRREMVAAAAPSEAKLCAFLMKQEQNE